MMEESKPKPRTESKPQSESNPQSESEDDDAQGELEDRHDFLSTRMILPTVGHVGQQH